MLQFEAMLAICHVVIGISVVPGSRPPLLSRHACSQLALIDCGHHSMSSGLMKVKNFGMSRASNGHYLLPIDKFADGEVFEIASDFKLPAGREAYIVAPFLADSMLKEMTPERNSKPSSSVCDDHGFQGQAGEQLCGGIRGAAERTTSLSSLRGSGPSGQGVSDVGAARTGGDGQHVGGRCRCYSEEEGNHFIQEGTNTSRFDSGPRDCGNHQLSREQHQLGCGGSHGGGEEVHCQEKGESFGVQEQTAELSSFDRIGGGLSVPVPCLESGGGDECGLLRGFQDASVPLEETSVAVEGEVSCGAGDEDTLEEESSLAQSSLRHGGQRHV